jgi:hypothetical protein
MAINSTDFTAEQLYKQQQILRQNVPMGTPLEYQGKGVPTMAPSTGKSMADWTTEEARNYALRWGAASMLGLTGIGSGIGYAATGALGRATMPQFAEKAIGGLPEYVSALKAAGGGAAGSRAAMRVMETARNAATEAKRISESQAMERLKTLMSSKPGLENVKKLAEETGFKLEPMINRYKDLYDYTISKSQNVSQATKEALDLLIKEKSMPRTY